MLLDVTVPLFILSPFVENAVRHGIDRRRRWPHRHRRARWDGYIEIGVAEDGVGLSHDGIREGIGLSNVRQQLEQLYGSRGSITLRNPESGTKVTVRIPRDRAGREADERRDRAHRRRPSSSSPHTSPSPESCALSRK